MSSHFVRRTHGSHAILVPSIFAGATEPVNATGVYHARYVRSIMLIDYSCPPDRCFDLIALANHRKLRRGGVEKTGVVPARR
ncbi:hypothetical protein K525DRAFT_275424 [Schizophyllum commune Loenen D]|nr:hypothetical protein K525DRAFT_275424 [Schizophyllum commune Loenen D]